MHTLVASGSFSGLISYPWEAKQKITSVCISADRLFSSGNSCTKRIKNPPGWGFLPEVPSTLQVCQGWLQSTLQLFSCKNRGNFTEGLHKGLPGEPCRAVHLCDSDLISRTAWADFPSNTSICHRQKLPSSGLHISSPPDSSFGTQET